MEVKKNKIVDNTFISSSIKEISCIDLIDLLVKHYNLMTCNNVYQEAKKKFENDLESTFKKINIIEHNDDKKAKELITYCLDRYPYLHIGEISSFVLFVLNFNANDSFYVTDDGAMRKSIDKIKADEIFEKIIDFSIKKYDYTGTIGLIKKLKNRKVLKDEDIEIIIKNISESSFRVTPDLLEYLRK